MQIKQKSIPDDRLLEGMRLGNTESLRMVYKAYYPVIESLVIRNNGSEYEARDIFQDSVILLYEKLQDPEFRLTCSIKTFLYAVCKRLWLKKWNEKKIRMYDTLAETEPADMERTLQTWEEEEKNYRKMKESLALLGEPCASILSDYYVTDLSMEEITEKYGYANPDTSKNLKYKCLQRLKKIFFETKDL